MISEIIHENTILREQIFHYIPLRKTYFEIILFKGERGFQHT